MPRASSGEELSIVLVEDHALVRAALALNLSVPGIRIIGQAGSAAEALELVRELRPDVMLVDIDLPDMSGIQLVRELAPRLPDCSIVMLTGSRHADDVVAAVRNGASGYLTKDMSPAALVQAVQGIRRGELPMPRTIAADLVEHLARTSARPPDDPLSAREREVLTLVANGLTDREVGEALGISPRTVGRHVGNILDKLGVRNRAEAARMLREM